MENDGQYTLTDYLEQYPKECCGVVPWLVKTKCVRWDASHIQSYIFYYQCPICNKVPCDGTEWILRAHGYYKDAQKKAIKYWNNPISTKHLPEWEYIRLPIFDDESKALWARQYGESYENYYRRKLELANQHYREKRLKNEY